MLLCQVSNQLTGPKNMTIQNFYITLYILNSKNALSKELLNTNTKNFSGAIEKIKIRKVYSLQSSLQQENVEIQY